MKLATLLFLLSCVAHAESNGAFDCTHLAKTRKAVTTVETTLAGVPAVLRIPKTITKPPIILWHGFGPPDSEQALMAALPLDDVPALKVYLGLPLFGVRAPVAGPEELARRQQQDLASLVFEPVVMGAAKELPSVVRTLAERGCIAEGKGIGLFGFSAGGAAVFSALADAHLKVSAAVTLNASTGLSASVQALERATKRTYAWTESARRLAQRSDAVGRARDIAAGDPPPALLIIHGADDAMLTPQTAVALHDALSPFYQGQDKNRRLRVEIMPGVAHGWTEKGKVKRLRAPIAAWFQRFL
jgi:predicted esterase